MLASIQTSGVEGERDDSALISLLTRLQQVESAKENSSRPEGRAMAVTVEAVDRFPVPEANNVKSGNPIPAPATADTGDKLEKRQRAQPAARPQGAGDTTIRLDVSLLDQLMNLVGELVLARNQILQCANTRKRAASSLRASA